MSDYSEIKELLRNIVGDMSNLPISGTITKVDGEVCTLKLPSGLEITDVRIRATIDGNSNFLKIIPKEGSKAVAMTMTGEEDDLILLRADEVEQIEYTQDGLIVLIDSTDGKVSIKNNSTDLLSILEDLSGIIKQLTVSTPNGPSGTPLPPTITSLTQWETQVKTLLK